MNWITVVWPMVAGACVALALITLRMVFSDGQRIPYLFFTLASLAVAAVCGFELTLMRTADLTRYDTVLRWAVVPIWIMVTSLAGFIWSLFGTGRKWLAVTAVILNGAAQIANLVLPVPAVRHAIAIHQIEVPGGVRITVPTIVNGSWNIIELVSVLTLVAYILDASAGLWKRGGKRRAVVLGGSIIFFFFVARGHAVLIEKGIIQTPYFVSFAFLGVLVAMGHELGSETLRAAQLASDLIESERRIDLAADAASLGFWRWDIERDEIWATEGARKFFGFSGDEPLTISRFTEVLHAEDRDTVRQSIEESVARRESYAREYRVMLPDGGMRWISARGRVEPNAKGTASLMRGVVIDITAQRQSEMELQRVRGQLAHTGRVSMLGQLASALAHELSQPLGAILRNTEAAEILMESPEPDLEELRAIIGDIRKDDRRAGDVIDRLRSMLKQRDLDLHMLSVDEMLAEAIVIARPDAAMRRMTLELESEADLPPVRGDRVHLQQVLLNLVLNAMDAMNENPEDSRQVALRARLSGGDLVEIAVSDQGSGIPGEKTAHIFEPFFTTKSQGMGIGLAISRTIIEAHHGRIWAENNIGGRGATFRFTLPVAKNGSIS